MTDLRVVRDALAAALGVVDAALEPVPVPPILPESAEFIVGPQLPLGASEWPFFDENQAAKAAAHAQAFLALSLGGSSGSSSSDFLNAYYYDLGLSLYVLAERSRDPAHLQLARDAVDHWWRALPTVATWDPGTAGAFDIAPRTMALGGLIIRALEGAHTEPQDFGADGLFTLWEWITGCVRYHYQIWLGARLGYDQLHYGVRDGGYMLLYTAWLAKLHPDEAVRAEMLEKAHAAARDYYARLQPADGGWYWTDGGNGPWEQPFMVGLLLEGMIAVHEMTADAEVAAAITRSVDHLYPFYRIADPVPEKPDVMWRSVPYFVYPDGTWSGEKNLAGGWDTNTIREGRQRNALVVHAFGYAYQLAGDPRYRSQGDEIFAATFGNGEGPLADAYYGLADFRAKEYSQSYRSAGRYLAWRQ